MSVQLNFISETNGKCFVNQNVDVHTHGILLTPLMKNLKKDPTGFSMILQASTGSCRITQDLHVSWDPVKSFRILHKIRLYQDP